MKIKVLKHGLRHEGKYVRCWVSKGALLDSPKGTLTVFAREYGDRLPKELNVENGSDGMTDYSEKDHARIEPTHPLYNDFLKYAR